MYFEDEKDWEIVDNEKDINYISRAIGRGGYFFVSEVRKP